MIITSIEIEKFRAFHNVKFELGSCITAIAGRNATQKTTLLGLIGQPFSISTKSNPMHGARTIDGYNFRSQFREKFKLSKEHDLIGAHRWTLYLNSHVYEKGKYTVQSIARKQKGKEDTLRFWNAESRSKGAGYIQAPVYYLSLSRLFPIGESSTTKDVDINLTDDEMEYCIDNYRTILSIPSSSNHVDVNVEQGTSSRIFSGVNDDIHDIFTNSAGESNVVRIILAVLSFRRLKEKYKGTYKGGVLLIDELDATLYGYSQKKLVQYLYKSAKDYNIQVVFTSHSPIIIKEVNKIHLQTDKQGSFHRDSTIVFLEPHYDDEGNRSVGARNIDTTSDMYKVINDILLRPGNDLGKVKVYCEDAEAVSFVRYAINRTYQINIDDCMKFLNVHLGWTNYLQLYKNNIPEFTDSLIILDNDVLFCKEARIPENKCVFEADNIMFLPLTIEKDLFKLLKEHSNYNTFARDYSVNPEFGYEVCFRDYPLESGKYKTPDFKKWYKYLVDVQGDREILFKFWCDQNQNRYDEFMSEFVQKFNGIAQKEEVDGLPDIGSVSEGTD